jgi:hypothetical protein
VPYQKRKCRLNLRTCAARIAREFGLRKLFRNLGERIDSTTLGIGFYNVRPDQSEGSATSHHGTALSNGSNVITTGAEPRSQGLGDVHNLEDTLDLNYSSTKEHFAESIKDHYHTMQGITQAQQAVSCLSQKP